MSRQRLRLTATLHVNITSGIRAGGFGQVSAQAWGVPPAIYESWLAKGHGPRAREPYRSFAHEVAEAEGQARLRAEVRTYEKDSKFWLEHGPGRATSDNTGWARPVTLEEDNAMKHGDSLSAQVSRAELRQLLQMLAAHRPDLADLLAKCDPLRPMKEKPRPQEPSGPEPPLDA